jgi:1,2-diacylglycerol 3-alpha-glucosyltransferase
MNPRVAIACSGLGHIHRGIEAWAEDLASALRRAGVDVTLFQGGGECEPWAQRVPCLRRFDKPARWSSALLRQFGLWRYGCGSPADVEQSTFSLGLWRRIRRKYDVLHVQDYWIGRHITAMNRLGLSRPAVIVGNGTGADPEQQRFFRYVQHLTPAQMDAWTPHKKQDQRGFMIPNFLNTTLFQPGDRNLERRKWQFPEDAFVVLAVAAIRKRFKRTDYLITEMRRFAEECKEPVMLVLAGAREAETGELAALAKELLGDRVRILENVPRQSMPSLYRTADVVTMASLEEVFGIAFLEAMSCGIPILVHDTPAMRWVAGQAGWFADLSKPGAMADALRRLKTGGILTKLAGAAREQVDANFSEHAVIPQIVQMYREVARA